MSGRPMISARRLRVALQQPLEVPDGIGGVTRSWQTLATLWARLEPQRGDERADAQRAEGSVSHRLIIRWRGDVTAAMRFVAGGAIYAVRASFDRDGRRRDLVCLVEEVQA